MKFNKALELLENGSKLLRASDKGVINYVRAKRQTNGLLSLVYCQHGFKHEYAWKPTNGDMFADDYEVVE